MKSCLMLLLSLAEANSLPKSSVSGWLQTHGRDTRAGLCVGKEVRNMCAHQWQREGCVLTNCSWLHSNIATWTLQGNWPTGQLPVSMSGSQSDTDEGQVWKIKSLQAAALKTKTTTGDQYESSHMPGGGNRKKEKKKKSGAQLLTCWWEDTASFVFWVKTQRESFGMQWC